MSNAALAFEGAGLVLDRYRPLKPLGTGGSGSVWLARDEQTGLDVALKIVPREGKAAARAEREAAAASRLRHPSCLRAYAFARDPGHVYIAYEYVPGRTFRDALRAGELRDADAIAACAEVCDGLAHAHAAGILHRDIKPSNVLLADAAGSDGGRATRARQEPGSPEATRRRAKILDFGLAQMAEAETLTAQGDVPGTLAYISPERLAGGESTPAADVWAIGVMLWEALSGRHPFWHTSMLDTARAIESGAPSLAVLRPDLPKGLIQLVDRSLTLDPAKRPSAADVAAGLRGAVADRRRQTKKRTRGSGATVALAAPGVRRIAAPVLAAAVAAFAAAELPFYPAHAAFVLAGIAALTTVLQPRLGLAFALAVPVFPLGNISLGLAVAYAVLAAAWFVLAWREPEWGLLFAVGPALAPLFALGLVPLAALGVRAAPRRAAQAAVAVLAAAVGAGLRHASLPLVGGRAPLGLGLDGARDPLDVVGSLGRALAAHPALLGEAAALAVLAAALPHVHGRWGAAGFGAAMLVLTVLCVPPAQAVPLAVAAWATAAVTYKRSPRG